MSEENSWKEFSDDISNMSKKIKSNMTDEENIEDLKNSLKATRESISDSFGELIQIVENTVKDDDIKEDALNLVNKLKHEMSNFVDSAREKVSEAVNFKLSEEE
jgi:phage-related tail protein|tara:strand:+ start:313 stop:624 length:312 start_codon:yes stop_codon:yes gene_type:complete